MTPRAGPASHEHGFSLVETVITLFLLGTGVAAVVTALQVGLVWTAQQRDLATVERTLQEVAEHVRAATFSCDPGVDYVGDAAPGAVQTSLRTWDGDTTAPGFDGSSCETVGVQLVGIRVAIDDGPARQTEVVKRRSPS